MNASTCCLRGPENPDLKSFPAQSADKCCTPCIEDQSCIGYTWNKLEQKCFLKRAVGLCTKSSECTSAVVLGRHSPPAPAPPSYPGPLTCGYTGRVPPVAMRTKPMLCECVCRSGPTPQPCALTKNSACATSQSQLGPNGKTRLGRHGSEPRGQFEGAPRDIYRQGGDTPEHVQLQQEEGPRLPRC